MKKLFYKSLLLILAMAFEQDIMAYDFEVEGIYYNVLSSTDKTVSVTYKTASFNSYSGFVVIPTTVTYNGSTYSVTSIDFGAFENSVGLTKVVIPNSVTSIGNAAFFGCSGLTSITIPNSVTSIGSDAFYGCSGLTSVNIGNSVTSIGNEAFRNCSGLTSVTIPNSVTSIGNAAFSGCSGLTSVNIGNSVTSIGANPYSGCSALYSISVSANNINYDSRDNSNAIINTSTNELITGCKNTIIPNSVTSIGSYAFSGCHGLTSVIIPDGVTSIGPYAFSGCHGLTSVTIPNGITTIYKNTFSGCTGLTSVTIPNTVTSIGQEAFGYCRSLTSVTIPSGVYSIGAYAFYDCSGLSSVTNLSTYPQTITSYTFSSYYSLHVKKGYKSAYQQADYWKKFNIVDDIEVPIATTFKLYRTIAHVDLYKKYHIPSYTSDSPDYIKLHDITLLSSDESIVTVENSTQQYVALQDGVATIAVTVKGTDLKDSFTVYAGSAQPELQKPDTCATPVISLINDKVHIECETEGTECHYTIVPNTTLTNTSGIYTDDVEIKTEPTYTVTCYATKEGYVQSATVTKTITLDRKDVNGDGKTDVLDVNAVIDTIYGK